jgi:hypothetical protein
MRFIGNLLEGLAVKVGMVACRAGAAIALKSQTDESGGADPLEP